MKRINDTVAATIPDSIYLAIDGWHSDLQDTVLTGQEKEEYDLLGREERRREFISSRRLVKLLVKDLGLDPDLFEVQKDGLGKPFGIYRNRRYNLSIAHTDEIILCGLSDEFELGVDMEPVDREVADKLRDRILHEEEVESLQKVSLIQIWTIKEAVVKLEGRGLRNNLNEIIVEQVKGDEFRARLNDQKKARVCSFEHGDYWISLAHYQ
ncbi:MAG: 4'-phosphopantetheinyl transferase superfamily protein [Balneolaceae bacterium]|nr:4'-phosphopantetheinyl transferase superfamily protein [Balneolaceae bacterium]